MGKNKAAAIKGQKEKAFIVNTIKKSNPKAVSTNLKKLNLKTRQKTDRANEKFTAVQEVIIEAAKTSTEKPKAKQDIPTHSSAANTKKTVDMDTTTDDFAKL